MCIVKQAIASKMFTNWLTTPTTKVIKNLTIDTRMDILPNINLESLSLCNSCSPDIIIEIGSTRFLAHSMVLSAHSGYLRSAIRMDDHRSFKSVTNTVLYLSNVTHEQFAPLLTYMYTGYLNLNIENILGILLATHVLHMPRALEICREFLSHAQQTDSRYFLPSNNDAILNYPAITNRTNNNNKNTKIIRPIASKPSITNLGFISLNTMPHQLHSLNNPQSHFVTTTKDNRNIEQLTLCTDEEENDNDEDIDVDEVERQSSNNKNLKFLIDHEEQEDEEEIFIDTNTSSDDITGSNKKNVNIAEEQYVEHNLIEQSATQVTKHNKRDKHLLLITDYNKFNRRQKSNRSSDVETANAPISISQLDTIEANDNKVIIDVASCDGPVRFKRILNTAYGQTSNIIGCSPDMTRSHVKQERSQKSLSLSFQQQMAKAISQHHQHLKQLTMTANTAATSANSLTNGKDDAQLLSTINRKPNDLYVCVYCNHTFKSQYCYQKHAKRHLNPLNNAYSATSKQSTTTTTTEPTNNFNLGSTVLTTTSQCQQPSIKPFQKSHMPTTITGETIDASITAADYLKRDIKPLDMNVQYFPCKTCGCKFPSYYFVHKHRKMCHIEEETQMKSSNCDTNVNSSATPITHIDGGK